MSGAKRATTSPCLPTRNFSKFHMTSLGSSPARPCCCRVFLSWLSWTSVRSGLVLMREGEIFPSYYHSCCGGATESAHNVWYGEAGPPQIKDRFCKYSPKRSWRLSIGADELASKLRANGFAVGRISSVSVEKEGGSQQGAFFALGVK